MTNNISVCIIYRGNESNFKNSSASVENVAKQIIVAGCSQNTFPSDKSKNKTYTFIESSNDSNIEDLITKAIENASGEWVLILEAGEILQNHDIDTIVKLCNTDGVHAYNFIFHAKLNKYELSPYEWDTNQGKFSKSQVINKGYIPVFGIRLFNKNAIKKVLSYEKGILHPEFYADSKIKTYGLRIITAEEDITTANTISEDKKLEIDLQIFLGTENLPQNYELTGPGKIGFPRISEKDLPSFEYGFALGFGQIKILKWAIHNLIRDGYYQKAISFADKIINSMQEDLDIFEIWHLRGLAFFYELDFENAEISIKKALEYNNKDISVLSNLARVYIISGKLREAKILLEKAVSLHGPSAENDFIFNALKQNHDRLATVSMLILCRDEGQYIERALESVKSVFDEIVAIDTGSIDNTIDILKQNGAKIVSYTWNDDFAEARNYGLSHASGDYVFWMDADEYLEDKDRLSLLVFKKLLPVNEKKGYIFNVHTLNGDYDITAKQIPPIAINKRIALFPNLKQIRFKGKIFESVKYSLEELNIPVLLAQSITIKHYNNNHIFRSKRKIPAMAKSMDDFDAEKLFAGIQFWLDAKNIKMAVQWFEYAILQTDENPIYLNKICKLLDEFQGIEFTRYRAEILKKVISVYSNSYKISTLCADYLYELKEYVEANKLLKRLSCINGYKFLDEPQLKDIQKNRLHFAMASLEEEDFETCNAMISLLSGDYDTADAARALSFYKAIRSKDIDEAILILDQWIKDRDIPISGTLNNFNDFIRLISDFSELVSNYGLIDASDILSRSADYFNSTITRAE